MFVFDVAFGGEQGVGGPIPAGDAQPFSTKKNGMHPFAAPHGWRTTAARSGIIPEGGPRRRAEPARSFASRRSPIDM